MQWALFRVDASSVMGSGHWMRCLTLADELQLSGCQCLFVSAQQLPFLLELTEQRGHLHHALSVETNDTLSVSDYAHSAWLMGGEIQDAKQCQIVVSEMILHFKQQPSWIIVDHYALAAPWETAMSVNAPILAIDDLHDRPHQVRWIVDQTAGVESSDYQPWLLGDDIDLMLGADYALIRPDFIQWRETSLIRRASTMATPCRLLVTLGGVDVDNVTLHVLQGLFPLRELLAVEVILGGANTNEAVIRQWCEQNWPDVRLDQHVNNMAERLAQVDLCVGAAGGTSWERCTLGLPTLQLQLADNQRKVAKNLDALGAAVDFGVFSSARQEEFTAQIAELLKQPQALQLMAQKAALLCDGRGCHRVVSHLRRVLE